VPVAPAAGVNQPRERERQQASCNQTSDHLFISFAEPICSVETV
jgi:hypothetical protein